MTNPISTIDQFIQIPKNDGRFKPKFKDEWQAEILELNAKGASLSDISKYIKTKYDTDVAVSSISNYLKRVKIDRATQSQAALRDHVGKFIINDLTLLARKQQELYILSDKLLARGDTGEYLRTIDRILSMSKFLAELSGANERGIDQSEAENAKADLVEKFTAATKRTTRKLTYEQTETTDET